MSNEFKVPDSMATKRMPPNGVNNLVIPDMKVDVASLYPGAKDEYQIQMDRFMVKNEKIGR